LPARSIVLPALLATALPAAAATRSTAPASPAVSGRPARIADHRENATADAAIASEVRETIASYPLYSVFDDVHAVVENGSVTLEGEVTIGYKSADIVRRVASIPGVRGVHDLVRTLPASTLDDELRVAVASEIYGDPLFAPYAHRADPPIHVVVEHGEVTLTGAVASGVERLKAEIDARDVFGVAGVDNDLVVAS
jgi:hypothetical protein